MMVSKGDVKTPYSSRFWRCLLGRPWRRLAVCGLTEGRLEELCQFAHPEMLEPVGPGRFEVITSQAQKKMYWRLSAGPH